MDSYKGLKKSIFAFMLASAIFVFAGCQSGSGSGTQKLETKTDYQAVLLDNGQAYFGKLDQTGPDFVRLKDVYYIQSRVIDQKAGQVQSVLLKRGVQEWHAPDSMDINTKHIVIIEPVGNDSKVAQLIKESKSKEAAK